MRVAAAWILALLLAPSAHAASAFTLELTAPAAAEYGQTITLRGRITPALAHAPLTLLRDGEPFAETRTLADGTFAHRVRVERPTTYQARAGELESAPVSPNVRPRLRVRFVGRGVIDSPLRLVVTVQPATNVRVRITSGRRVILNRTYFDSTTISLGTRRPSRLRVSVAAAVPAGWSPATRSLKTVIVVPRLALGSRGPSVRVLEERLLVSGGQVVSAVHVSTGATGNTPLGRWRVYRRVPGWDWVLLYPMYFLRGFAIHGYPSVPTYAASHGCVRVPMWIAPRLYAQQTPGATAYVYS